MGEAALSTFLRENKKKARTRRGRRKVAPVEGEKWKTGGNSTLPKTRSIKASKGKGGYTATGRDENPPIVFIDGGINSYLKIRKAECGKNRATWEKMKLALRKNEYKFGALERCALEQSSGERELRGAKMLN